MSTVRLHRVRGGWTATVQPWSYDTQRYEWVARQRTAEQQAMREYRRDHRPAG